MSLFQILVYLVVIFYHCELMEGFSFSCHKHNNLLKPPLTHRSRIQLYMIDPSFNNQGIDITIFMNQISDMFSGKVSSIPTQEVAQETSTGLGALGSDFLAFLCATICIVPLFKWLKASSVIGECLRCWSVCSSHLFYY